MLGYWGAGDYQGRDSRACESESRMRAAFGAVEGVSTYVCSSRTYTFRSRMSRFSGSRVRECRRALR